MATQADKINTGAMATIVVVLAISVLGIAAALTALVRYETQAHGDQKGVSANMRSIRELVTKQRSELSAEPAWVDKNKELVSVPVERAMELVLQDLRKDANLATEGAGGDGGAAPPAAAGDAGAAPAPATTGDGGSGTVAPEGKAPKPTGKSAPKPAPGAPQQAPAGKPAPNSPTPPNP
jgi:hypothetical protein